MESEKLSRKTLRVDDIQLHIIHTKDDKKLEVKLSYIQKAVTRLKKMESHYLKILVISKY